MTREQAYDWFMAGVPLYAIAAKLWFQDPSARLDNVTDRVKAMIQEHADYLQSLILPPSQQSRSKYE